MRKLLWVSVMILLFVSPSIAQDEMGGGSGPTGGELLFEITASPLSKDGPGSSLLSFGQLRGRYFLTDRMVPRLGVWYNIDDNGAGSTPDVVNSVSEYMFAPGFEYHFLNEGGFTSYAAVDVLISGRSAQRESATGPDVVGSTQVPSGTNYPFSPSLRGFFGVGGNFSVGGEYHFGSRFYFGAEVGVYFMAANYSDVEVDGTLYQEGFSFFNSGVNTSNSFRVGFKLF